MTITVRLDSWVHEGQDPLLAALVEVEVALGSTSHGAHHGSPPTWLHHLHRAQMDAAAILASCSGERDIPLEARAAESVALMRKRVGLRDLIAVFLSSLPADLQFVITATPEACRAIGRVGLPVQEVE